MQMSQSFSMPLITHACGKHESAVGGPCWICNPPNEADKARAERIIKNSENAFSIRRDAPALLRIVRELREIWAGEDIDPTVMEDLDAIERVGRWLVSSRPIETVSR